MKLQFSVQNMACGACAKTITEAVKSVDSSAKVAADPKTKRVDVETEASETAVREAMSQAGYAAS